MAASSVPAVRTLCGFQGFSGPGKWNKSWLRTLPFQAGIIKVEGGMAVRTYNLFISHSWNYGASYDRLYAMLRNKQRFRFKNYSVPRHDPIHNAGSATELREAIYWKMKPCSVVLVVAGVYATYSKWMGTEMDLAKKGFSNPKPIVAVRPRGSKRVSAEVTSSAMKIVAWNTDSIVRAIREVTR